MKKILMVGLTVLVCMAFISTGFAQTATEKATKAATDAAKEKGKEVGKDMGEKAKQTVTDKAAEKTAPAPAAPEKKVEKKAAKKAKAHQYTGEVTAIDMAAKSLTVKGKDGDKTFDIAEAKMKAEPKAGDRVKVKFTETDGKLLAGSVTGIKGSKKATEKEAKPADKAAPAPVPAK